MNDIFKDMQAKVGCEYISDLPSYKRKVWHEMKRLNPADYEERQLEDFSKSKKKFFVRSSSSKEDIEKVFGNVEYVDANIDGEFGFITEKISEATFAKKADELGTVISRIRIEG